MIGWQRQLGWFLAVRCYHLLPCCNLLQPIHSKRVMTGFLQAHAMPNRTSINLCLTLYFRANSSKTTVQPHEPSMWCSQWHLGYSHEPNASKCQMSSPVFSPCPIQSVFFSSCQVREKPTRTAWWRSLVRIELTCKWVAYPKWSEMLFDLCKCLDLQLRGFMKHKDHLSKKVPACSCCDLWFKRSWNGHIKTPCNMLQK